MAKYQRVSPRFWQDPKVRRWGDQQKLLAQYFLTCPHRTTEGLFWLPRGYIAQDLGWGIDTVFAVLSSLIKAGFVAYDEASETVFLCKALKYEAPAGPKQIQGAITRLVDVPPTPLFAQLSDAAAKYAPDFCKAMDEALDHGELRHHPDPTDTPPKGYPNRSDSSSSSSSSISSSKTRPSPTGRVATAPATITPIPTAQTFVAAYVDAYRGRAGHDPPSSVKGQVAKRLREAIDDGVSIEHIRAGFVEWFDANQHPATLPSFIEVAGRNGQPRGRASPTRAQQQLSQAQRTYEEMMADASGRMGGAGGPPQPELARPTDHQGDR